MTEPTPNSPQKPPRRGTFGRWAKRLALGLVALAILTVLGGMVYQVLASARDAKDYPPPGRLVDVGGHRLHINTSGEGAPTVVLDAGVCDCSLNWCLVQPKVARFTRVCAYDRAGMGWSEPGPAPRTSERIVEELHTLLKNADIPGPYVLVGHSFGGYNVRLFAHKYPNEVAGLVLVDAAHEDQWEDLPASVKGLYAWWTDRLDSARLLSHLGVVRLLDWAGTNPKVPAERQAMDHALRLRTAYHSTLYDEWSHIDKDSAAQVRAGASLPSMPLMVLTAEKHGDTPPPGVTPEDFARWNEHLRTMQADLAGRCTDSIHITVADSSHAIPFDQPAAVVDAIRRVVTAVRKQKPLRSESL